MICSSVHYAARMPTLSRVSAELTGLRAAARAGMIGPMPPAALLAAARSLRAYGPLGAVTSLPAHRFPDRVHCQLACQGIDHLQNRRHLYLYTGQWSRSRSDRHVHLSSFRARWQPFATSHRDHSLYGQRSIVVA